MSKGKLQLEQARAVKLSKQAEPVETEQLVSPRPSTSGASFCESIESELVKETPENFNEQTANYATEWVESLTNDDLPFQSFGIH